MKIGLIHEGKNPPDNRVALTPQQCAFVERLYPVKIIVEPSPTRCFSDSEFEEEDVKMSTNLQSCDFLLGIKEVPIEQMIPNKAYFFFSHTIKKQVHNRPLLKAILDKKITLIDYEVLTDEYGQRLIAFGKFAGMVGAHNGILGHGLRTAQYTLPRMKDLKSYAEARTVYEKTKFPALRVIVSGSGRVAKGAIEVLLDMNFKQVEPQEFLTEKYEEPIFTQVHPEDYIESIFKDTPLDENEPFDKQDYYKNPIAYRSTFHKFYKKADIFINCIFYDKRAPAFFTLDEMQTADFKIQTIADVSCDLVPFSSIPSTIKVSTIADPFYGFNPFTSSVTKIEGGVTMMTIDNLPNELPRDASAYFGEQFILNIIPELQNLMRGRKSKVLERATVTRDGKLTPRFEYLQDYVSV
jgi:saccharopine dehydrogenase (NAD+, L-lysine forming)